MDELLLGFNDKLDLLLGSVPFGIGLLLCLIWGLLSVLFCPCHLALIPLLISYIKGMKNMSITYALSLSLVFSFAILLIICCIGTVAVGLGNVFKEQEQIIDYVVGFIFLCVGLHICGVIKYHHHDHCDEEHHDHHCGAKEIKYKGKGHIGAFVYGLIFGVLLAPCTFAYMAPIMGVALKRSFQSQFGGFLMVLFYGLGNVLIITLACMFSEYISKYNHWNHDSKASNIIKLVCGIIIILAGLHLFFE